MTRLNAREARQLAATFPDKVAARSELVALGIAGSTVTRRCASGGPWRRLLPGVILLHSGDASGRQRLRAALLHGGSSSVITGLAAARRYGVARVPGEENVQVLVPAGCHVGSRGFVIVQRTSRLPPAVRRAGIRLAPTARSLVDASGQLDDLDDVRAMLADAVQRRICSVSDLAAELEQRRRPHTRLARTVLAELTDGIRSAAEAWARTLSVRSGLPAPRWNVAVRRMDGRLIGIADAYWPSVGMAWEIDSHGFHLDPAAHVRGAARQSEFAANGVLVVHTVPSRLRSEPAAVLDELQRTYQQAAARPTPAVLACQWRP